MKDWLRIFENTNSKIAWSSTAPYFRHRLECGRLFWATFSVVTRFGEWNLRHRAYGGLPETRFREKRGLSRGLWLRLWRFRRLTHFHNDSFSQISQVPWEKNSSFGAGKNQETPRSFYKGPLSSAVTMRNWGLSLCYVNLYFYLIWPGKYMSSTI